MKAERNHPKYTVTPKAEAAILRGHPWVYDAEVLQTEGEAENGGLVDVVSKKGPVPGHGLSVGAVQDPGTADLPQRQRPV